MKLSAFLNRNPVFTTGQMAEYLREHSSNSRWTCKALLAYHVKQGRIMRVRRGLYVTVPEGIKPSDYVADPYLLASRTTDDAVLSHHTALEYHGKAYSVFYRFTYLSLSPSQMYRFQSVEYKGLRFPEKLVEKGKEFYGVTESARLSMSIKVTNYERTLVDLMDRPRWGGSWDEIWRSLEMVEFFSLEKIIEYTLLLENASTAAKVGFYLEQHREDLMVEESHLNILKKHKPKNPHYFDRRSNTKGQLLKKWNLVVPVELVLRSWEEPFEAI